jgi:hypothetical protein
VVRLLQVLLHPQEWGRAPGSIRVLGPGVWIQGRSVIQLRSAGITAAAMVPALPRTCIHRSTRGLLEHCPGRNREPRFLLVFLLVHVAPGDEDRTTGMVQDRVGSGTYGLPEEPMAFGSHNQHPCTF